MGHIPRRRVHETLPSGCGQMSYIYNTCRDIDGNSRYACVRYSFGCNGRLRTQSGRSRLGAQVCCRGQFWTGLQVDIGSGIAGGTWYSVVVGKAHPALTDTLIRNSMKATCTLQGPGELAFSWIENRHLRVICTQCRRRALTMHLDSWGGSFNSVYF